MHCKNCKWRSPGFSGKPSICMNPIMKVIPMWNKYKDITPGGVGYIDQIGHPDTSRLFVHEEFGCVHFTSIISPNKE